MRWIPVLTVLGMILCLYSFTFITPILVGFIYKETVILPFVYTFITCFLLGFMFWSSGGSRQFELRNVEGIMVVVLSWVSLCLISSLPFILGAVKFSLIDSVFEAVSGLTTTGNEVFTGLDFLPKSVQYYHQQLEFVGGLGIIVLATSVLPLLGVGGMEIYQAEVGGPVKDSKLMPKIKETAILLWEIYFGLAVLCILCYLVVGLDLFEAICASFATVSTGGFSIHDNSFSYYNSHAVNIVSIIFMLLGGLNFSLHFSLIYRKNVLVYFKNYEARTFLMIIPIITLLVLLTIGFNYDNFIHALLSVVSMMTTTGFTTVDFASWPGSLPPLLLFLAMIGGCAGSTSGGIKLMRAIFIFREGAAELKRLSHPNAVCSISHEGEHLPPGIIDSIRGFISVFLMLYIFLILLVMHLGVNFHDSFAAVTSCLSNAGASIAGVAENFAHLSDPVKIVLTITMIAGRLEIMTLVILFTPSYWRA